MDILLRGHLLNLGFSILREAKTNENGPDLWVIRDDKPFSVEIKTTRRTKWNSLQVAPVEKKRRNDDFIAIKIENYYLIEPMSHHLKNCSKSGYRTMDKL